MLKVSSSIPQTVQLIFGKILREGAFQGDEEEKVKNVFKLLSELQGVYAKSYLNLNNIEQVFGALELAKTVGKLGVHSVEEISELRKALVTLIVGTLEKKVIYPFNPNYGFVPTAPYQKLADILKDKGLGESSIITFNYDVAVDFALYFNGIPFDYCLVDRQPSKTKLLKLHGSTNWGRCTDASCEDIVPYDLSAFRKAYPHVMPGGEYVTMPVSKHLRDLQTSHPHAFDTLPVIVPPTWNKTEYHGNLSRVWHEAANELSMARNIYVFGYSLPETDAFFRYLFALGTIGETRIRRFWVFDPDPQKEVESRFRGLLGQGIIDRFEIVRLEFPNALDVLRDRLGLTNAVSTFVMKAR